MPANLPSLARCTSIGWVVKSTKKALTLAASRNDDGALSGIVTIPTDAIRRKKRV